MNTFVMNGYFWRVQTVPPDSPMLVDRTGHSRVATTDPLTQCIYLSDRLEGSFLNRVLLHELGHVVMLSYGLILAIRSRLPERLWIEAEEWCCNLIADYGEEIFAKAYAILGDEAWSFVPGEMGKIVTNKKGGKGNVKIIS